jgi:hypothetical protein
MGQEILAKAADIKIFVRSWRPVGKPRGGVVIVHAFMAKATAKRVLPTPGGPKSRTFSFRSTKVRANRLKTFCRSSLGWKVKSYSSKVFWKGSPDSMSEVSTRRCSFWATSSSNR